MILMMMTLNNCNGDDGNDDDGAGHVDSTSKMLICKC